MSNGIEGIQWINREEEEKREKRHAIWEEVSRYGEDWTEAGEGNGGEKRIFFFLLALEKPLCAATVGHRSREKEATGSPAIPVPPAAPALAEQVLVRAALY